MLFIVCISFSCRNEGTNNGVEETPDSWTNLLSPPQAIANPKNDDEFFFNYRLTNFAPSTEPLIKQTFGDALVFEDAGFWEHSSYTSHVVGFSTNLPTISIVEYGETTDYGHTTTQSESYYYQHLHYIKGLESGKTYHYRFVAQDNDGIDIVSADHTFTTKQLGSDVIRIPEDMEGEAPYTLTQSNAKYVVTQDLTVPTMAINIKANNVELELDGHTIIYDDGAPKIIGQGGNDYAYNEEATFGIRTGLWNYVNVKIFNGIIRQGRNGGTGFVGHGFNPLYFYHMGQTYNEVAGITVDYYGNSVGGMVTGNGHVHHNVLYDRGTVIDDRHGAIRALSVGNDPNNNVSFNSLRRFRHRGIDSSGKTEHNELYSDSFDTNSFALGAGNNAQLIDNRIFGMGYLPIGIGWGNNLYVKNNFIYMRGFAPTMRSSEYPRKSAIAGMRVTNYNTQPLESMLFEDNTIVLKPEEGCTQARGIWTSNGLADHNIVYRRNTVKVEAMPGNLSNPADGANIGGPDPWPYYNDNVNYAITAVTFSGSLVNTEGIKIADPIIFEDNHLIGNVNLVVIGEGYGICNSVWMYRTKLEKIQHDSEFFRPVRLGFWYWDTWNNRMVDNEWIGISENEKKPYFFGGTGKMEMRYGEHKSVTFKDRSGATLANTHVILTTPNDDYTQIFQTDVYGNADFDILSVRHFKYGNSQEHDGVRGEIAQTDYQQYVITISGYKPLTVSLAQLKNAKVITMQ
jgi:hypothetical protein